MPGPSSRRTSAAARVIRSSITPSSTMVMPGGQALAPGLAPSEAVDDVVAESPGAHQAADDGHGEDVEQTLVGGQHQRALGHRQLDLGDLLPGGLSGGPAGLDRGRGDGLDAVGHQLDGRRGGVDDARDDRGEARRPEEREHGDQVDERRDRLAGVEQRPDAEVDPAVAGHPDAEDQRQDHHQHGGDQGHVQRDHRVVPQIEVPDAGQADDGADQRAEATEDEGQRGDRERRRRYHGESASSDCIGLRKPLVIASLNAARHAAEGVE